MPVPYLHYTSLTFFSGRLRTGLPSRQRCVEHGGRHTQIVGSPTPPQKSYDGNDHRLDLGISARRRAVVVGSWSSTMRPFLACHLTVQGCVKRTPPAFDLAAIWSGLTACRS